MTSNAPPAPSGRFAERVADFEASQTQGHWTTFEIHEMARDLLAVVREQQAALAALADVANNAQCLHELEQARAVLGRWRIE